jgi:formylglycine-generating enzyme required for sulfatase activity
VGASGLHWLEYDGGIVPIGHDERGFAFDNEWPRHHALLQPHRIASRLATAGDYLAFMDDGGYQRHELWLSQGWDTVKEQGWEGTALLGAHRG